MSNSDKSLNEAMLLLASHGAIFIGQGVEYPGHAMFKSLEGVPAHQRIELPVVEEMQMGIGTGLAMQGFLPVLIYPRCDFLLRAMDQLVNHLDKMRAMTCGAWNPKVVIRTRVGQRRPLDAGPQHTQNHAEAFRHMLTNVVVEEIEGDWDIRRTYEAVLERDRSTIVVEAF